jgi:hypothetical protein
MKQASGPGTAYKRFWNSTQHFTSLKKKGSKMKSNVFLDEQDVRDLFNEEGVDSEKALKGLFLMIGIDITDDNLISVGGFPKINKKTNEELFALFIKLDGKNKSSAIPGGLWMNYGFSSCHELNLQDWEVSLDEVNPTYKKEQ